MINIDTDGQTATSADASEDTDISVVETDDSEQDISETEPKTDGDDADDGGDISKEMKTIKKALNKKNRYIDNQRARIRSLDAQIQQLKSQNTNTSNAPEMGHFESVIDYMKADQSYTLDQKLAEQDKKQQIDHLQNEQKMVRQQQVQIMAETMSELLNSNQDVKAVIGKNNAVIQAMPPHIEALMFEIDNAPAATYALAKEGRLQDLYYMAPHIAAAHLVQAEIRGQQYLQQAAKPRIQAPQPIGSLKGAGKTTTKPLAQMSPSELDKWRKS